MDVRTLWIDRHQIDVNPIQLGSFCQSRQRIANTWFVTDDQGQFLGTAGLLD
ncbi:MAG TPA: hypothetical protein VMW24_18460 [Sedimentisphaerales bacterium]|nr:hypothetical protein [Sedimentisphaerales bacterium]